jgi:acyl carrier protein
VLKLAPDTQLSKLKADGMLDSLDAVELVMAVEDEFRIELSDDDIENVKTVGDYVKLINEAMGTLRERGCRTTKSTVTFTTELTYRQHEKLQAKGGEAWLKKTLNK